MFQFLSIIRVQDYQGGTQSLATIITGLYDVQRFIKYDSGLLSFFVIQGRERRSMVCSPEGFRISIDVGRGGYFVF